MQKIENQCEVGIQQNRITFELADLCVLCVYYFVPSVVSVFLQPLTTEYAEIQPTEGREATTEVSYTRLSFRDKYMSQINTFAPT